MFSAKSTTLIVIISLLVPLSTLFVALRFKVRKSTRAGLGLDDYTILATLIFQYGGAAKNIYGAVDGSEGDSLMYIMEDPSRTATYAKIQFIGYLMFTTTIALVKISTLILYKRIFVIKRFHNACYVMLGLTVGWFLASIFGKLFSTKTVSEAWASAYGPFVINYADFLLSMAAINMVLDALIVCMPLFVIRTLQMSPTRKVQISGIFLLGSFCTFASAIRLYYLCTAKYTATTPPYTEDEENELNKLSAAVFSATMWFLIESFNSIIAACLPTLAPLFHGSRHVAFKIRRLRSMQSSSSLRNMEEGSLAKG